MAQNYTVPHRPGAIDTRVAKHLAGGVMSSRNVALSVHSNRMLQQQGAVHGIDQIAEQQQRLMRGHPQLEADYLYLKL